MKTKMIWMIDFKMMIYSFTKKKAIRSVREGDCDHLVPTCIQPSHWNLVEFPARSTVQMSMRESV